MFWISELMLVRQPQPIGARGSDLFAPQMDPTDPFVSARFHTGGVYLPNRMST